MFKTESERSGGVMREVWLAANRRALLIAMLPAWLLLSSGLLLSLWLGIRSSGGVVAWLAAGVAGWTLMGRT